MLNSKSYSKKAITESAKKIRFFNENVEVLLLKYSPSIETSGDKKINSQKSFITKLLENKKAQLEFGVGVMSFILLKFFDGEANEYQIFCEAAIREAFDYGHYKLLDTNSFYFSFQKVLLKGSFYVEFGEIWANKFIDFFESEGL